MSRNIVFQGEPGANSHIACLEAYPDLMPLPCPTFEDALGVVASGNCVTGDADGKCVPRDAVWDVPD